MNELDIRKRSNCRLGLIAARKSRRMSQEQLANSINYSRSLIALLEMGVTNASDDVWKRIKRVLQVKSVEELWEKYSYENGVFYGDDGSKIEDPSYTKL